jgi:hypothetical protein
MKLTEQKLREIIQEELTSLNEASKSAKGILTKGAKATYNWGEDKLYQLSDEFENFSVDNDDDTYDSMAGDLNMAVEIIQDQGSGQEARGWLKKFTDACKEALKGL